ncbi:MAG: ABC-2 transporter permease [Oscillospiraceae bacterium]|nr:ABC-2 transporter permease [Oscillospiraceae bacterium]
MKSLLFKELRLSAHILTYLFLAFSLMAFIPGYPILVSAFFICFGIFQTFQNGRETGDVLYTVLLPVEKRDAVRARYAFVCLIQLCAFLLLALFTAVRMALLGGAVPYVQNPMMNANPVFLGWVLIIFAQFNVLFVGQFYKTAYKFGRPFVTFIIVALVTVAAAETLHHIPGLEFLNTSERLFVQLGLMAAAGILYAALTVLSCKRAQRRFELLDL